MRQRGITRLRRLLSRVLRGAPSGPPSFTAADVAEISRLYYEIGSHEGGPWDALRDAHMALPDWFRTGLDPWGTEYAEQQRRLWALVAGVDRDYDLEVDEQDAGWEDADPVRFPAFYKLRDSKAIAAASDHVLATGMIMKHCGLRAGDTALEYGAGFGQTALALARMGVRVDTVDISRRFCDFVRRQGEHFGVPLTPFHGRFGLNPRPGQRYQLIWFYESFHHCLDFQEVVPQIEQHLAEGGRILLAGEPIVERENAAVPYPWGLRLHSEVAAVVRRTHWFELGFSEAFLYALFERHGLAGRRIDCEPSLWGRLYVFTRMRERRSSTLPMTIAAPEQLADARADGSVPPAAALPVAPRGDWRATVSDIAACFQLLLGRDPSPAEVGHFGNVGVALSDLVASFLNSREFALRGLHRWSFGHDLAPVSLDGFQLLLSPHDPARGSALFFGAAHGQAFEAIAGRIEAGMTVLDIGAGFGQFTMLAAWKVGSSGRVFAVEPDAELARMIEASRRLNAFDQVQVWPLAAGGATLLSAAPREGVAGGAYPALTVAMDTVLPESVSLDLVRVAVGAAAASVLEGLAGRLRRDRPVLVIAFDAAPQHEQGSAGGDDVLHSLVRLGYHLTTLDAAGATTPCGADVARVMSVAAAASGAQAFHVIAERA